MSHKLYNLYVFPLQKTGSAQEFVYNMRILLVSTNPTFLLEPIDWDHINEPL